jgi:hypothetical protein
MTTRLKVELFAAVAVTALLLGGVAWYEHGITAAREALDKEHKAETAALVEKLTTDSEKKITQANQVNAQQVALLAGQIGQLSNRMVQLSGQLVVLQAAQAAQLAEIQKMTTPELIARLRVELGPPQGAIQAVPLTQADLVQVDSWKVQRDGCQKEAGIRDQQLETCQEISGKQDTTITTQAGSIKLLNDAVEAQKQIVVANAKQCAEDLKAVKKPSRLKWAVVGASLLGAAKLIISIF